MTVEVKFRGPLLEGRAPAIINSVIQTVVGDVLAEGERDVKLQLRLGHGLVSGHYRRSIHGEIAGGLWGVQAAWGKVHDSNVVYGPWLEGVSSRNQTTRFKGYAMFRNATLQRGRKKGARVEHRVRAAMGRMS